MKIAILMSGEMRTLDVCAPSFTKHILEPLQAHAEVSIHCAAAADSNAHKAYEFLPFGSNIVIDEQPWIDEANYILRSGKGVCGIQSVLKQFWSWRRAWEIAESTEFDFAVRVRADTLYYSPIESPDTWHTETLYCPRFSSFWGICDRFGYGDRETMRRYHTILDRLDEFMNDGAIFHPESLVPRAVGFPLARSDVLFATVRDNGELRPPAFMREIGDVAIA
jgi:hypothetical protein